MIGNNDENLRRKGIVYKVLGMLEGKNKDGGGGGGGMLLCRRVMMVSSSCIRSGRLHDYSFFFSVYRQLGSNKQASTLAVKILLLKILHNQEMM